MCFRRPWIRHVAGAPPCRCHRGVQLWYRARKEAGIEDVRLHDLRHTVASQAVARGGSAFPTRSAPSGPGLR